MRGTAATTENKPLQIYTPAVIYGDPRLSLAAKFILAEVLELLKVDQRWCWASNRHFEELFVVHKNTVSNAIQQIQDEGWFQSNVVDNCDLEGCQLQKKGTHRHIFPLPPLTKIVMALSQKIGAPITKNVRKNYNRELHIENRRERISKKEKNPHSINESDLIEIAKRYKVPLSFVKLEYEKLLNYCTSTGKTYKNYKAALRNFVLRDAEKLVRGASKGKVAVYEEPD